MNIEAISNELSLYMLQQLLSRLLYTELYLKSPLFVFLIGFSGFISGINPCIISIATISLAYLNFYSGKKNYLISLSFGIFSILMLAILFCSVFGYYYYIFLISLPFLSAVFAILLGLLILDILNFKIDENVVANRFFVFFKLNLHDFFIGCFLAISTLPCIVPIIIALFVVLSSANNYFLISFYICVYLFSYMLPLLVVFVVILRFRRLQLFILSLFFSLYKLMTGCFMLSWGILKCLEIIFP